MSAHITRLEKDAHGFTMLAEQDVPVEGDVVDEALSRPAALGRWFDVHYEWPTSIDEPLNVGAALEFTAAVGPLRCEFIMIVADRVPGESLMLRTTKGPTDATVEITWTEADGGVHVIFEGDFRLRGSLWWKSPWSQMLARRAVTRGLERMRKDLLSHAQTPTPALLGRAGGAAATPPAAQGGCVGRGRAAHRKPSGRRRAQSV